MSGSVSLFFLFYALLVFKRNTGLCLILPRHPINQLSGWASIHQKSSGFHINNNLRAGIQYLYANVGIKIHASRLLAAYFIALPPSVAQLSLFFFFFPWRNLWSTPADDCHSRSIQIHWLMLPTEGHSSPRGFWNYYLFSSRHNLAPPSVFVVPLFKSNAERNRWFIGVKTLPDLASISGFRH